MICCISTNTGVVTHIYIFTKLPILYIVGCIGLLYTVNIPIRNHIICLSVANVNFHPPFKTKLWLANSWCWYYTHFWYLGFSVYNQPIGNHKVFWRQGKYIGITGTDLYILITMLWFVTFQPVLLLSPISIFSRNCLYLAYYWLQKFAIYSQHTYKESYYVLVSGRLELPLFLQDQNYDRQTQCVGITHITGTWHFQCLTNP